MITAIIIGIITGFFSGFLGVGGGTILVPMLLFLGFPLKEAIGISVTQMMMSSIYGSFLNYKKGLLKIKNGISLALGGALGASLSGIIVKYTPKEILGAIFLTLVAIAIIRFFITVKEPEYEPPIDNKKLFFIGFFVGAIAISVGVGGAILITPILVGFLKYKLKTTVSLSLFFVVFSSVFGFISQSIAGHINYTEGFIIGFASLIGTYFGVKLYHKVDTKIHKKILLIWYIFIFFAMIYKLYLKG
ncbi:sulfite exporter TauE/SafE family protein [Caminibacter mediatlanticus TB-2]|uniref:Probable membrane transporter protein n=1 Tax=Caminibacter mediatlanticus TB-2 TaxID=391592 RepID=A0ABX5VDE5_9BACT|nr:sulfite exporter TauE/SafE family protein [Caminibacter mediatlanticus]QCT95091.1 sulfite exporter TauE/SafE family protein [Caminibacter mediatlanticus TB-2]